VLLLPILLGILLGMERFFSLLVIKLLREDSMRSSSSFMKTKQTMKKSTEMNHKTTYSKQKFKMICVTAYTLALCLNVVVVGGLNFAFVYLFFNYDALDYMTLQAAQVVFAAFKVLWSAAIVPGLLSRVRSRLSLLQHTHTHTQKSTQKTEKDKNKEEEEESMHGIEFQTFMVLLNNIALPCLAAALFSSHCFYDAVVPPAPVRVLYSYPLCSHYELVDDVLSCEEVYQKQQAIIYHPSFAYRHQCSSALIMEYVPIFLFMFLIVSLVVPALQLLASALHLANTDEMQRMQRMSTGEGASEDKSSLSSCVEEEEEEEG
jgi:hypothetical protein